LKMNRTILTAGVLQALAWTIGVASGATLGTVVPIRGQISDIAVDTARRVIYAANFTGNRIDAVSMDSQSLLNPAYFVGPQPSSLAISRDNHFLVVGHYEDPKAPSPAVTIINLDLGQQRTLSLGTESVLAVAFGNGPKALLVLTSGISLLDPATATLERLSVTGTGAAPLPVPWATFPPEIMKASASASGDGKSIYVLVDGPPQSQILQYQLDTGKLVLIGITSAPQLGPRSVSVDATGTTFMAGWALFQLLNEAPSSPAMALMAQFPYPAGVLNQGSHVFDWTRGLLYAQVTPGAIQAPAGLPPGTGLAPGAPLLHVMDSDNLAVREIFQLKENLAGKSVLSGDTMYSVSDSGLTILPMGSLASVHRVQAVQEDLFFQASGCSQTGISQFLDIVDPGGGNTAFTLTTSSPGIRIVPASGTTPARVQVFVDPTAFQDRKGTASVPVQIVSAQAANVPFPVRLLINTGDPDQMGAVHNISGTIVDVVADPWRDRFYVLRQDRNQVLVFNGTTFEQIATLRTGNTPVQMAVILNSLLVTNDNSQVVNVFDLTSLQPLKPVYLPSGLYGRSIAVSNTKVLLTTRSVSGAPPIVSIDMLNRTAIPAFTGIFRNEIDPNSALAASPSGGTIFMAMPNGVVALYDAQIDSLVASRKDLTSLSGAYAALSDDLFIAGNNVLNTSLVPMGQVDLLGGTSSGVAMVDEKGLMTTTPGGGRSGVIQRFSPDQLYSISPERTSEAPSLVETMTGKPVGQIGQTILPFTRTLAALSNGTSIIQLSTSGFTAIPWAFDTPLQPPVIRAVTKAADATPALTPGELITIWGSGLSGGNASASAVPLPKGLGGVCLYANAIPLPMLFVSPNQINAQLPWNIPGSANIVLSNASGQGSFSIRTQSIAPGLFRTGAGGPVIIRTVDGKLITNDTPIHLNEVLNIYMTGMGPVDTSVNTGDVAPSAPLAATLVTPSITIGGANIWTLWSGLAPGLVGVYQVNAQVPFKNIPKGDSIPFTITQGGISTTVNLKVEQ
jgi:uncharacterized protein (TIGR03437 family)